MVRDKPILIDGDRRSGAVVSGQAWRTPADVDSDRLLYSTEFRRLAGVTQVVPPQDDFVLHDRLTHSLKVAQIASSLAKMLVHEAQTDLAMSPEDLAAQVDPVVCYAAGLAHDIGHPPFGHAAEVQLQEELKDVGGDETGAHSAVTVLHDSFEGNAQSFRIVTRLSFRKEVAGASADGLDLTWRTLAAIAKYPWTKGNHPSAISKLASKWSVYDSEVEYLQGLRDRKLILETYNLDGSVATVTRSVEAEIMDWADDIAYAVHDLEDFFRSRRTPLERVRYLAIEDEANPEWTELFDYSLTKIRKLQAEEPEVKKFHDIEIETFLLRSVVAFLPTDPFDGTIRAHEALKQFASKMIDLLEDASRLEKHGDRVNLRVTAEGRIAAEFLKSVTQFYLIHDPSVETMQMGQKRMIGELYRTLLYLASDVFLVNADKPEALRRLPVRLREYGRVGMANSSETVTDDQVLSRAVIDFLCGLTDKQATLLHEKMTGNPSGGYAASWLSV